eukprot:scaffold107976_cov51-Attheya_sp.AAC.1
MQIIVSLLFLASLALVLVEYTCNAFISISIRSVVQKDHETFLPPPIGSQKKSVCRRKSPGICRAFREDGPVDAYKDFPLSILIQRTLDTVEDAAMHLRRLPYELGWREETDDVSKPEDKTKKTVVVLGSGWAAHAFLKVADASKFNIIVVSPQNHFVFTPMLASAAVGTVEYRSMTEMVRAANPLILEYIEGSAVDVDVDTKKVTVKLAELLVDIGGTGAPTVDLDYDCLIVAAGAKAASAKVPGAADKCLKLKSCDDARRLRTAVGESFEYASRPLISAEERKRRVTFLVVGGGPTGVELAGELSDLISDVTRSKGVYPRLREDAKVVLAHGAPDLLPQFEKELRDEALAALKRRGVDVRLNTRVTSVEETSVKIKTRKDSTLEWENIEESSLPVGLKIWCAGTEPTSFVKQLLEQLPPDSTDPFGRVKVDGWLRPPMNNSDRFGSIFVLGDAASFVNDKDEEGNLEYLPQTAQVAGQQGAYIARLLSRGYDTNRAIPVLTQDNGFIKQDPLTNIWLELRGIWTAPTFSFLNLGLLAYVGGGEALSQVQIGDVKVLKSAGSVAFLLWRSVYLVKQVASRNRILVTFDWIKSALFGRDVTRF